MVMRFERLDLNLLVALHALLEEKSVSKAATRLNTSQPAMSAALAKLREFFEDDLLIRSGREMVPTAQGAFLMGPVTNVLTAVQHAVATKPTFDPATADRVFKVMLSDYTASVLLPSLLKTLRLEAPNIRIEVFASDATMAVKLERREIDLAIIPDKFLSPDHPSEPLLQDGYVVVVDKFNSYIGESISLEQYVKAEHVVANNSGNRQASFEDWFLEHFNVRRKAILTVPMFSLIPEFVVDTEFIGTMHSRLAASMSKFYNIRTVKVPETFPQLCQSAQFHRLSVQDLGLTWLRAKFQAIAQAGA